MLDSFRADLIVGLAVILAGLSDSIADFLLHLAGG
jgi:hypothetical protein